MKDFSLGIMKCRCSQLMKRGKYFKMFSDVIEKTCPNCGKKRNITRINKKPWWKIWGSK